MEQLQAIVFLVAVIGYTVAATICDQKLYKIPNMLTLPMFFAGWVYQGVFAQWDGLANGGLGFLVGFGILFVLWMVGSAGGGDVKLLGGLSVWLGFQWTLYVLVISTFIVIMATVAIVILNVVTVGPKKVKKKLLATGKARKAGEKPPSETVEQKKERRIMAYAFPIGISTWLLLGLAWSVNWPAFPWTLG